MAEAVKNRFEGLLKPKEETVDKNRFSGLLTNNITEPKPNRFANLRVLETSEQTIKNIEDDPTFLETLNYYYDKTNSDVENAGIYLESYYPIGNIKFSFDGGFDYISPDELYGDGFSNLTPNERRQIINDTRQKNLELEYPDADKYEEQGGVVPRFLGAGAKILTTPTTALPVGQSYKTMAAIGGFLGAEYEVLDQLAKDGEVNKIDDVLYSTATGMIAAPAIAKAVDVAGKGVKRVLRKKENTEVVKKSNDDFDIIYDEVVKIQASQDVPPAQLPVVLSRRLNKPVNEIKETIAVSNKPFVVPTKNEAIDFLKMQAPPPIRRGFLSAGATKTMGVLSSNIARISKPISQLLVSTEGKIARAIEKDYNFIDPIIKEIKKSVPKNMIKNIELDFALGNLNSAKTKLNKFTPNGSKLVDDIQSLLKNKYDDLKKAGINVSFTKNYMPRMLKDRAGLRQELGYESVEVKLIDDALEKLAKKQNKLIKDLTPEEESIVYNSILTNRKNIAIDGSKSGILKKRTIGKLNEDMLEKYYHNFDYSLRHYIASSNDLIQKANLFGKGKSLKVSQDGSKIDIAESVGDLVQREVNLGRLNRENIDTQLRPMLETYLGENHNSSLVLESLRSLTYLETIGNYLSAITQLGDIPHTTRKYGLLNTIENIFKTFSGRSNIAVKDVIGGTILEELNTVGNIGTSLNKGFTEKVLRSVPIITGKVLRSPLTFFGHMDRLGKSVYINSAFNKGASLAKTEKGIQRLKEDYGDHFGDEFSSFIQDLKNKKASDNVMDYLFHEASDTYPISKLETPELYQKSPEARIAYTLKTYTVKSIYDSVVRRGIKENIEKGRYGEAAKNTAYLFAVLPLANASIDEIKDFVQGRPSSVVDIPNNYADNLFKMFGANEYLYDRYLSSGEYSAALGEIFMPPLITFSALYKDVNKIIDKEIESDNSEFIAALPVIGRVYANWVKKGRDGQTRLQREINRQTKERDDLKLKLNSL
tara:strand:- start:409 stop:3375 length:2967 start_codon:yes stop_codon:yes gene_type:complete